MTQQIIKKTREELLAMVELAKAGEPQDFSYQDLSHLTWSNSYTKGSIFRGTNLTKANFRSTNLTDCDLSGANLENAILWDSILIRTNLTGANLTECNLILALLGETNLTGANLSGSNFLGACIYPDCIWTNCNLEGAYYGYSTSENSEKVFMTKPPIVLETEDEYKSGLYRVMIFDRYIKIGCQVHTYKEWLEMTEDKIEELDADYGEFLYETYRSEIIQLANQHGCSKD
ncbi:MAG TPA: pentapeptide repeat-containing protein [Phormidium sp.]